MRDEYIWENVTKNILHFRELFGLIDYDLRVIDNIARAVRRL